MPLHTFLHNLLNVGVQTANRMGLLNKKESLGLWTSVSLGVVHNRENPLDEKRLHFRIC
jgi:hypothetical protein